MANHPEGNAITATKNVNNEAVYIGLGANLNQPDEQIIRALEAIAKLADSALLNHSSLYSSKPLGPQQQPDYVNAVAVLQTDLQPQELLEQLQKIELEQGRQRKAERWGPRSLDLDIILFGNRKIQTASLTIPHYHFHTREFVLYPLSEIVPELVLPDGRPLNEVIKTVSRNGLSILQHRSQILVP